MNLPVQHLSDEAVAAFADRMLTSAAHNRAARHLAVCPECAAAVEGQRVAVSLLRAAPTPMLPAGLLERLRAVPITTSLTPSVLTLAPDGSAVFPAYGTAAAASTSTHRHDFHIPVPHPARRTQQLALVAVAAAMMTVGLAASASADTAGSSPVRSSPVGSNPVQLANFTTTRETELVGAQAIKGH